MTQRLRIGLDLDGVIIDHTSNKLQKAHELGYVLEPRDTASAVMKSRVSLPHYREIQRHIYGPATATATAVEGALETIATLAAAHDLYIISRRNVSNGTDRSAHEWIAGSGIFEHIPKERVFFVPHDVVGAKGVVAKKLGIELYLDDQLKILHELPSVGTRILFDPFGTETASHPFRAIKKWQEFPAIIARL